MIADHQARGEHGLEFKWSVQHPFTSTRRCQYPTKGRINMIILGIILLVLGFVFGIPILWTIGIILIVVGAVLTILGATGRAIGGRKTWY